MTVSAIPDAAIGAQQPTSRSVFRMIAKAVGATNREADTLRHELLARVGGSGLGQERLVAALHELDRSDRDGSLGAEGRLAVWFSHAAQAEGADAAALVTDWADGTEVSAAAVREVVRILGV